MARRRSAALSIALLLWATPFSALGFVQPPPALLSRVESFGRHDVPLPLTKHTNTRRRSSTPAGLQRPRRQRPQDASLHAAGEQQRQQQREAATATAKAPTTTAEILMLRSELTSVAVETEQLKVEIEHVEGALFGEGSTRYLGGKGGGGRGEPIGMLARRFSFYTKMLGRTVFLIHGIYHTKHEEDTVLLLVL